MVVKDSWLLYRKTANNDHLIKWSLCTGFLKKSVKSDVKIILGKPNCYKVHRSCKQLNEVSRSGKALHKLRRICQQLYKVRRICEQL